MADTFASRFAMVASGPGPLVWGLDPSGALLEAWGLGDSPGGLDRFADIVPGAAAGTVHLEPELDPASAQALFLPPVLTLPPCETVPPRSQPSSAGSCPREPDDRGGDRHGQDGSGPGPAPLAACYRNGHDRGVPGRSSRPHLHPRVVGQHSPAGTCRESRRF